MASFFSKKQYTAIADEELTIKLLNERCLECSICTIFFSSSLTVSIKALLLSRILSAQQKQKQSRHNNKTKKKQQNTTKKTSCCFYLRNKPNTVKKEIFKQTCLMFPLSAHSFPLMFSRNLPCFNGS